MSFTIPIELLLDSYKLSHPEQYPKDVARVCSNFTPRSDKFFPSEDGVVFFGLQYFMLKYLVNEFEERFFNVPVKRLEEEFAFITKHHLGDNAPTFNRHRKLWELGYLPLVIKALPEGSLVPIGVPMFTIENTLPEFAWLTNSIETLISTVLWKPCVSATIAYNLRRRMQEVAILAGNEEAVDFQCHDFSMRGMSGIESAMTSAAGHLLSFSGTDTVGVIPWIRNYYKDMPDAFSVPASEHSTACACSSFCELGGYDENHLKMMLDTYPTGIVSVVSDTFDFFRFITEIAPKYKDQILGRDGKVVFRPDSGNPVNIVTGYHEKLGDTIPEGLTEQEKKGAVACLDDVFGSTTNKKGYKELNEKVGLIYGDSITYDRAQEITGRLIKLGYSPQNCVFGVGSYTYQYNTRDTFGFAMKATNVTLRDGTEFEIFKDPVTDSGLKKSAKGLLRVDRVGGKYCLSDQVTREESNGGCLKTVFENGLVTEVLSYKEIKERLWLEAPGFEEN